MILCRRLGFAIVCIPRGGSTAMRDTLLPALRPGEVLPVAGKHFTAASMAGHLSGLRVITVDRDPCERMWSLYCLYQREAANLAAIPDAGYRWYVEKTSQLSIDDFVENRFRQWPGGFWRHFCHTPGGENLVNDPWPFAELPQRWRQFAAEHRFPALPIISAASVGDWRKKISTELEAKIRHWEVAS